MSNLPRPARTLALALALAALAPACILVVSDDGLEWGDAHGFRAEHRGSGVRAREVRVLPEFTRIEPEGGSFDLRVRIGSPQEVAIVADDNLLPFLTTEVQGGALRVGLERGSYEFQQGPRIEITVARLERLELSGSGDADLEGFDGGSLVIDVSGSGDVRASGRVDRLDVQSSGSGDVETFGLEARVVRVDSAGSGDVEVTATEELEAELSGSGDLEYRGSPARLVTRADGSGDVTPR